MSGALGPRLAGIEVLAAGARWRAAAACCRDAWFGSLGC
jgi:hypothetical protein